MSISAFAMAKRVNRVSDIRYKMKAVIEFLTREGRNTKRNFYAFKGHLW